MPELQRWIPLALREVLNGFTWQVGQGVAAGHRAPPHPRAQHLLLTFPGDRC